MEKIQAAYFLKNHHLADGQDDEHGKGPEQILLELEEADDCLTVRVEGVISLVFLILLQIILQSLLLIEARLAGSMLGRHPIRRKVFVVFVVFVVFALFVVEKSAVPPRTRTIFLRH